MTDEKKLYTVQGNVQTVYAPQKVESAKGNRKWTSEKTDVILQTPKGGKVRVTFWDQAVEQSIEGSDVSITNLKYGGVYKETNQFSSTKESKIHVLNASAPTAQVQEDDPTNPSVPGLASVAEPTVSEPEPDVDPVVDSTPVEAPKKRGRPVKAEVPTQISAVVSTTNPNVVQTPEPLNYRPSPHPSEALVLSNLQAAERIARILGYDRIGMVELITLGDMVGRTAVALRIEAGKDQRMANYKR